jgi:hypothetical protein
LTQRHSATPDAGDAVTNSFAMLRLAEYNDGAANDDGDEEEKN